MHGSFARGRRLRLHGRVLVVLEHLVIEIEARHQTDLLREIGLEGGDLQRLAHGVAGGAAALPPAQPAQPPQAG